MSAIVPILVVFAEPAFPLVDVAALVNVPGAVETRSVEELAKALQPGRVLVWRHGSAFPAEAWEAIDKFLDAGGSLAYVGGQPFTRPAVGAPGRRVLQAPTVSLLKALRLNQCYPVEFQVAELRPAAGAPLADDGPPWAPRTLAGPTTAFILEPRLADTKDFAHEDGAPGARDALLRPIAHLHAAGDDPRFPAATAAIAIDRLRGRWAGGRWVLWLLDVPPTAAELDAIVKCAAAGPVDFRVDPVFGCFHAGERPSVLLRLHRPRATEATTRNVNLIVTAPDGSQRRLAPTPLRAAQHASTPVPLQIEPRPGLYRVTARAADLPDATTGFWVFDPDLFASGEPITADACTLRRGGQPLPVVGTTAMSPTVHRKFLFEPNAAAWDDTFAELAALRVNLVRTGVWSAFRKISVDPNVVDEAWLRALEAYYLSARKHDIPVIFTFFAFLPESFGGENPYFDPRAVEGQRAYVAAVAARFAPARQMLWDLINEPSFSSPNHLWKCRPNGDKHEERAFIAWLRRRHAEHPDDPADKSWEAAVRNRWRLRPDEKIELPKPEDFEDRHIFGDWRPYRAADYERFAQDAFADWAATMCDAIRDAGSTALVTVGQDEGGLTQRPSPLFHHGPIDFTSIHTWWLNDRLLWDGVAARAAGKPLLVSETGVMQRELLSGAALRRPEQFADLLSRKIGYAFAAGACGVVQWCYDVNPYMASDNEAAIGLRRPDGSFKPEHRVLREFADFVNRNRTRFEQPVQPPAAVIIPADVFSRRDTATPAVQRAIALMYEDLRVPARLVPDARAAADLGDARLIILPATRGVSHDCWQALTAAARAGSVVLTCGWFETDDAGLPAERLGLPSRPLSRVEPCAIGAAPQRWLQFPAAACESWYAAVGAPRPALRNAAGAAIWHHPLPLEWAETAEAARDYYAFGAARAALVEGAAAEPANGLLVREIQFRECILVVAVNESSQVREANLRGAGVLRVPPGLCRMAFVDRESNHVLDVSHADAAAPATRPAD